MVDVAKSKLRYLLLVPSFECLVQDGLQVRVAKLEQLGIVADASVWIDASLLKPRDSVGLVLLEQDGESRLYIESFELIALAHAHWVALQDPSIDLAVGLRYSVGNQIVKKMIREHLPRYHGSLYHLAELGSFLTLFNNQVPDTHAHQSELVRNKHGLGSAT